MGRPAVSQGGSHTLLLAAYSPPFPSRDGPRACGALSLGGGLKGLAVPEEAAAGLQASSKGAIAAARVCSLFEQGLLAELPIVVHLPTNTL